MVVVEVKRSNGRWVPDISGIHKLPRLWPVAGFGLAWNQGRSLHQRSDFLDGGASRLSNTRKVTIPGGLQSLAQSAESCRGQGSSSAGFQARWLNVTKADRRRG